MRIKARKLLSFTPDQLKDILTGVFELEFYDGQVIQTDYKQTIYTRYFWDLFTQYPQTPITAKHHVLHIMGKDRLSSKTHILLLQECRNSVIKSYGYSVQLADNLSKLIYQITNKLYNTLSTELAEYSTSVDILDFIEIIDEPTIKQTVDNALPTEKGIQDSYNKVLKVLKDEKVLTNNAIAEAVKAKLVNDKQVLQCVAHRGFLTDMDSVVFPKPIMRGYVKGLRSAYDSFIESRSASKALFFSKEPLEDTEYFSRKLQILCQTVKNLHHGDCGSTIYMTWHIKGPVIEYGETKYSGDLPRLIGKTYLDESTNTLKEISKEDKHLVGTYVRLRSILGCMHPDPNGVCSTCFGGLSRSVPENTNLGQYCSSSTMEPIAQNVLSTKHYDGSSVVDAIVIEANGVEFLTTNRAANAYMFKESVFKRYDTAYLIVDPTEAHNLTDITMVDAVEDLTITRVSEINTIGIKTSIKDAVNTSVINVAVKNRKASFTHQFLAFLKENGWQLDEKGNHVIDMSIWDFNEPFLVLPQKQESMADYAADISTMIESSVQQIYDREKPATPMNTLTDLFDLINMKIGVNLAAIEIILYAALITDFTENDYRLPKPWTKSEMGVLKLTVVSRSLSGAMAYNSHAATIYSPASYSFKNRPSHPMDVFIMPQQTVDSFKNAVRF